MNIKRIFQRKNLASLMVMGAFAASTASAHTSYLKPNTFSTTHGNMITLLCSFTEDFSNPAVVVKSDDWHYYTPDGERHDYDSITSLKQVSVLEQSIEKEGTYRFTTGVRYGRKSKNLILKDGTQKHLFGEAAKGFKIPEGAEVKTSQTVTVADVYVTKGSPTSAVVNKTIGRLVLKANVHPNEIYMDDGLEIKVSFDGNVLQNQTMLLSREAAKFDSDKGEKELKTDANGVIKLSFSKPGVYLLATRHKADAPKGSETDVHSFTTSLTFEVTP